MFLRALARGFTRSLAPGRSHKCKVFLIPGVLSTHSDISRHENRVVFTTMEKLGMERIQFMVYIKCASVMVIPVMELLHARLYSILWSCFTIATAWSSPQLRYLDQNQALSLMDHRYLIFSLFLVDVSTCHVCGDPSSGSRSSSVHLSINLYL